MTQEAQDNYGLGGGTDEDSLFVIKYKLSRAYMSLGKRLVKYVYVGGGYALDYYYDIYEDSGDVVRQTDFGRYQYGTGSTSIASGPTFDVAYGEGFNWYMGLNEVF